MRLLEIINPQRIELNDLKVGKVIEFLCNGRGRGGHYRVAALVTKINAKTVAATEVYGSYSPMTRWAVHKEQITEIRERRSTEIVPDDRSHVERLTREAEKKWNEEWRKKHPEQSAKIDALIDAQVKEIK